MPTTHNTQKRAYILDYPVDLLTMDEALQIAESIIAQSKSGHVVTINPEMIAQANKIPELSTAMQQADLVIPDGIGVIIGLKTLGITTE